MYGQQGYGYGGGGFQGNNFQQGQQGQQPGQGQQGGMGMGMGGNPPFLNSQPTGFGMPAQRQQPMQTGFQGFQQPQQPQPITPFQGFQQPQQQQQQSTGAGQGNQSFLGQPPSSFGGNRAAQPNFTGSSSGGLVSQMTGFAGGGASGLMPMLSQPTGMGYGGGGIMPQATGMGGGLRPQPTGVHDPRLQQIMQSFMPSNTSQPFNPSGMPQFSNANNQPLSQTFQSLLDNPKVRTPKVPWTLSKQEKKDYDQIFRAWDVNGDSFITGEMAIGVFGQSGLNQDDLMKIWNLSDVSNRGQLNLPEFHVAMGLIYRALNGNDIPDQLPEELVPASMKDIDTTVNFMRDLLKHESSNRSNTASPAYGDSRLSAASSKDASAYKHDDAGNGYKPSSRHLDRKSVRYAGEDPDAEISDIRRQLQNTSAMLDKSATESAQRSDEDERLEQEVDDLKYRVKRLQEDIDYVSKGRRSADKDEERRKLERELLFLMHEKLPELERRQQQREDEKRMEERAGVRARDKRNDNHGRYGRDDDREDRDWLKGTYDRDRERDRRDRDYPRRDDRDDRDRDYDRPRDRSRERDRDREYRPRSPPSSRNAPAPPPAAASADSAPTPAAPPPPTTKAAAAPSTKNMTPEERSAFIREQAQRRIQDRLRALGVESASSEPPAVDNSVQERLDRERKEAEEKSNAAEKEQAAREEARQKRLGGGAPDSPDDKAKAPAPPAPASPAPLRSAMKKPAAPPPAPVSRSKQPPAPPPSKSAPTPQAPAPKPKAEPAEDPEEVEMRQREEARKKAAADRKARMAQLEKEEEEERIKEEQMLAARQARSTGRSPAPQAESAPPPPPPPPAPAVTSPPVAAAGGYNPFRKPSVQSGSTPSPAAPATASATGGFNPFFRPPPAAASSTPAQSESAPPPPPPAPAFPQPAKKAPADDEWEQIQEKDNDSDSSDDDYATSRASRAGLASALFGNITGGAGSRPGSAGPGSPKVKSPTAAPANKEALAKLGGGNPAGGGMGNLLSAIQGGARLKKAQTVEKGAAASGRVIGDAAPPAHINAAPRPPSPAQEEDDDQSYSNKRQSVDWYAGLAADQSHPAASHAEGRSLEPTREEDEHEDDKAAGSSFLPSAITSAVGNAYNKVHDIVIGPSDAQDGVSDEGKPHGSHDSGTTDALDEFDTTQIIRVRSLYSYDGQRDVDLSFAENVVISAHPAKDVSSPWWYGTVDKSGEKGWFPHAYVEEMNFSKARALFPYDGGDADQLPFLEGDILNIVDRSDADWWKTEKAGVIFIVPASYLELDGADTAPPPPTTPPPPPSASQPVGQPQAVPDITHPPPSQTRSASKFVEVFDPPASSPGLQVPSTPTISRLRSSTVSSAAGSTSFDEEGETSDSGDSALSWWSSGDESDSEDEADKLERKRREETRQKILEIAGLVLKKEPTKASGAQSTGTEAAPRKRRPAPAAPAAPPSRAKNRSKSRRKAPGVPKEKLVTPDTTSADERIRTVSSATDDEREPEVAVQDAYARYEQYLSAKTAATGRPRSNSQRPPSLAADLSRPASTPSPTPTSPRQVAHASGLAAATAPIKEGKITGFFSRMMAPSSSDSGPAKRTTALISAPIVRVDTGEPGVPRVEAESDVGKTWSSLVDPSVLETMSPRERKRQEAIFEFIATEATYNRDLQLIVNVFFAGLLNPDHGITLDEKALTVIFANIEDILLFNTSFYSSLEARQKACRLYIDTIGDILQENAPGMTVYETYCVNQSSAERVLRSLRGGDPALQRFLEVVRDTNPDVRGLDLSSFLLIPMQRITRYPLLLRQIAQYTEQDQDLHAVQAALERIEAIVANINESIREVENHERLRVLSEDLWVGGEGRIDLTAPTQYQGQRRLLKEGIVTKSKSGKKLTMVLCNDILLLIESRNLYRMPIPLFELAVREGRDGHSFAIKVDRQRGGDTIGLKAASTKDTREWVGLIEQARRFLAEELYWGEGRIKALKSLSYCTAEFAVSSGDPDWLRRRLTIRKARIIPLGQKAQRDTRQKLLIVDSIGPTPLRPPGYTIIRMIDVERFCVLADVHAASFKAMGLRRPCRDVFPVSFRLMNSLIHQHRPETEELMKLRARAGDWTFWLRPEEIAWLFHDFKDLDWHPLGERGPFLDNDVKHAVVSSANDHRLIQNAAMRKPKKARKPRPRRPRQSAGASSSHTTPPSLDAPDMSPISDIELEDE